MLTREGLAVPLTPWVMFGRFAQAMDHLRLLDRVSREEGVATFVRGDDPHGQRHRHIHVNLIPLNPVAHRPDLRAPTGLACRAFARRLEDLGVPTRLRTQRGDDIHAACGQLALERAVSGPASPQPRTP